MNKTLRFSLLSMLIMLCSTAFAGSIIFANLNLENGKQYTDPFDGGDFTVTFAGGGNDGKYYDTGSGIRVYGDGTMTITAKSGTLTKVLITYDGANKPTEASVVNTGTYNASTGMWSGDAETIVFTRPSGSGHWRIQAIATGKDAEEPDTPTEGQTPETAITATRALEIINALADGATATGTYYVKGVVTSIKSISSSNAQFYFGETASSTDVLQTYNTKGLENKNITNTGFVKQGDEVVVFGSLQKYKNNSTGDITPEVSNGYVYSVNGVTKDSTPDPEEAITKGKTADSPMTVADALGYINNFSDGFITSKQYYVQGTIGEVTEISTDNGNATFIMSTSGGNLTAFRLKGLENKNITDAEYIESGDEVIVYAKLQKYVKDATTTPELSGGYIYSLNGKTKEDDGGETYTFVGDGSKENPYTVEDVKHMAVPENTNAAEGQEKVWVKGIIAGALNGQGTAYSEESATNIGLGATADDEASATVPVQLPSGNLRAALNVVDNPENKGKEVLVYGYILKYMSKTGMKNTADFILDGDQFTTGINDIKAQTATDDALYNVAGQRINGSYKGIVIRNGKKMVVK